MKRHNPRSFTLIELLVVAAIAAILARLLLPVVASTLQLHMGCCLGYLFGLGALGPRPCSSPGPSTVRCAHGADLFTLHRRCRR